MREVQTGRREVTAAAAMFEKRAPFEQNELTERASRKKGN
jgi:hypothetical protein